MGEKYPFAFREEISVGVFSGLVTLFSLERGSVTLPTLTSPAGDTAASGSSYQKFEAF